MRGSKSIVVILLAVSALVMSATTVFAQVITISDLGTLVYPRAIIDSGQVVGTADTLSGLVGWPTQPIGEMRAFLWQNGVMTNLGSLGGGSDATAINDRGQIVGVSYTASGQHAFVWQDSTMTDLGTLGGSYSYAVAINNRGQIVGVSYTASDEIHPFLWQDRTMTDLGTLGGIQTFVSGINELGQVVGSSSTASGFFHGVLWQNSTMIDLGFNVSVGLNNSGQVVGSTGGGAVLWDNGVITDLGTLGGSVSDPRAINDLGQVVGASLTASGEFHAFLWQNSTMIDLGTLGGASSIAVAINERGQVVGYSDTATGENHAFFWQNGVMTDLGTLGGTISYPFAINNRGQVIGNSLTTSDVEIRGVVWCIDEERPLVINEVTASPNLLWPPDRRLVPVTVTVLPRGNCNTAPACRIYSVKSNEPVNGLGDGKTEPDWIITGDLSLSLRAERSGMGNGRTYTIAVTCSNDCALCPPTAEVLVTVPLSHR